MTSLGKKKKDKERKICESTIEATCQSLRDGIHLSYNQAAIAFGISVSTLWHYYLKKLSAPKNAHEREQLLNNTQEKVLAEWIQYLGSTGYAVSKQTIQPKFQALCRTLPSFRWISCFLDRNPELVLGCPSGLDPKRARAFNPITVEHHFELLENFIQKHDIPWENVYNMNKKGI